MYNIYIILGALWLVWELKYILFWLYLWQLKEYHLGRFLDHFRTSKGKKLILNYFLLLKVVLLCLFIFAWQFFVFWFSILFLAYFLEFLILIKNIYQKTFKKPVKTFKILFLSSVSLFAVILFLWLALKNLKEQIQPVWLVIFDILTPVIISLIVLLFQPIFVFFRNRKLKEAEKKIDGLKTYYKKLKVIAITGSYGKTSTKEFLSTILSKKFKVLSTNEHQNSEIGIAKCILNDLKPTHQIFIAEVGAYNKGKVKEVCSILKPKFGIVTGVNEQHLALFGSMDNLLSAEGGGELADALPKDGILFVNGDNKYCLDLYKNSKNKIKKIYSASNKIINPDVWAQEIEIEKTCIHFVAVNKNKELAHFKVNVLGKQNVQNLLGAILMANELGMNFGEIAEACKNIRQEQAGMTLLSGKHGIDIVDSSYSSNPDGVFADLEYFSIFKNKKVIVMPCLIELGKNSAKIHENIGKKIGEVCDMAIITSKDKFKEIEKGFNETKKENAKCLLCDNSQEIYSAITVFCKSGDAVLLEGRVPAGLINLLK